MPKVFSAVAFGLVVCAGSYALAEDAPVEFTPEHKTIIRQFVVKEGRPVKTSEPYLVWVGNVVPGTVVISPFTTTLLSKAPELKNYQYVRWGGGIVLVEPDSRKIIAIIY